MTPSEERRGRAMPWVEHIEPRSRKDGIVTVVCKSCGYLMQHDEEIFGMKDRY
jgi:hypothetical protein